MLTQLIQSLRSYSATIADCATIEWFVLIEVFLDAPGKGVSPINSNPFVVAPLFNQTLISVSRRSQMRFPHLRLTVAVAIGIILLAAATTSSLCSPTSISIAKLRFETLIHWCCNDPARSIIPTTSNSHRMPPSQPRSPLRLCMLLFSPSCSCTISPLPIT